LDSFGQPSDLARVTGSPRSSHLAAFRYRRVSRARVSVDGRVETLCPRNGRSLGFPPVAELPRVVHQGNGTVNDGLQIGLDLKALLAELFAAAGFPKGPFMPHEERLECLLGSLLGVEHDVFANPPRGSAESGRVRPESNQV